MLVAGRVAWFYLGKVVWPADLVFNYPRWTVDSREAWQYLFPAAAIAALGALFALRRRARGPLATALLFVGILFPALGFINVYPFIFSYVADHFQYLAAAALISGLAAGCAWAVFRLPPGVRRGLRLAGACLVALLACLTWGQSSKYRDIEVFYRSILERNPKSWLAHDNLGVVLARHGQLEEAAAHYRSAIALNPRYPEAFNNLGNALAQRGRFVEAADAYAGALRARPTFFAAELNWGSALNQAGLPREAEPHYRNALRLKASSPEAHFGLANTLVNSGRLAEASSEYAEAIRERPGLSRGPRQPGPCPRRGGPLVGGAPADPGGGSPASGLSRRPRLPGLCPRRFRAARGRARRIPGIDPCRRQQPPRAYPDGDRPARARAGAGGRCRVRRGQAPQAGTLGIPWSQRPRSCTWTPDAFFVSCEQARDPSLVGKKCAVGGTERGIISSASYEARACGVLHAHADGPGAPGLPGPRHDPAHLGPLRRGLAADVRPLRDPHPARPA